MKTVLCFKSSTCAPCKMMTPIIEELAKENPKIKFEVIMSEEHPELAGEYNILAVPTFVVLDGDKEVLRWSGYTPKDMFLSRIS